ncbi:anti-sigma regulatory factor [uncultured Anaerococcus sp.]|uniref:anti-sigma regulatory factor n=1 Tax=uncultured Anaerococcus sp. TaxID=293428 RepID=UPI0025FDE6FB|nr:anti-sigma regulatory factor [uncultured Anaerococcus sp.]
MDKISIKIPASKRYQKSVRLFVSGLGLELDFNVEQIEDLKVLVSEAINYKIGDDGLDLAFLVEDRKLSIEVVGKDKKSDPKALAMRNAILSALADEIEIEGDLLRIIMRKTHA